MSKQKRRAGMDGVVKRRRKGNISDFDDPNRIDANTPRPMFRGDKVAGFDNPDTPQDTMNDEDAKDIPVKKSLFSRLKQRRQRRKAKRELKRQGWSRRQRIFRDVVKYGGMALVLIFGYFAIRSWLALNQIIDRDGGGAIALQDNIDPSELRGEGDGRVNIMILGIGGPGHDGGNLADTIIIASIDPFAPELALLSIPRDMYVDIPGYGSDKINASHAYGEDYEGRGKGVKLTQKTLEQTLDIPIHYYVRGDFKGFIQAVDAVGGVDINVKNPVINDYNFSWMTEGRPLNVPEGPQHLDGLTALLFARSRYTSPRGDFDRNDRQRQILLALKDKVLSLGTFSDPRKISSLIGTAGTHVRTNLQLSEMLRVYEILSEIENKNVISVGLTSDEKGYLVGSNVNGASVQVPKTGNYAQIQKYVRKLFVDGFIRLENASIDVLNGTGTANLAKKQANTLESYGYRITKVGDAPSKNFPQTTIYDLSNGDKPYTKRLLERRFNVNMVPGSQLPSNIATHANFVIILGRNAS